MKKMKAIKMFAGLFLFMFILALLPAYCASPDWKLVVRVSGEVQSLKANQTEWDNIWQSRMLRDGDKARTLLQSRATVRLADNTVVTLGENTLVEVSQFKLTKDSRVAKLDLIKGKIRVQVAKFFGKESKFEVTTPSAVLAARGTDFYVEDTTKNEQASLIGATLAPMQLLKIMVFEGGIDGMLSRAMQTQVAVTKANFALVQGQMAIATQAQFNIMPIPQASMGAPMAAVPGSGPSEAPSGGEQAPTGGVDADLTNAGFGSAKGQGQVAAGQNVAVKPPTTGTPSTTPVIVNPTSVESGSLPVVIQ